MVEPNTHPHEYYCKRCGTYQITHEAMTTVESVLLDCRPVLSEWVYQQNRSGLTPSIQGADIPTLLARGRLRFADRVRRLLVYLAERSPYPGIGVPLHDPGIRAMLQTYADEAVEAVFDYIVSQGWAYGRPLGPALTGKGLLAAEEQMREHAASAQGFVAMWFDNTMEQAWKEGFERAIIAAGYEARRIDRKEHVNKICDEIIAEIRRSRFLVADFTGQRGGVYYEAGFASGREIPVIGTCRKSQLGELHFDVRQYNCIDWEYPAELSDRLQARIEAVIGKGPLRP